MTLTPADVAILTRRFAANEHETREGGKSRDQKKAMWLFYVEEEAIIERLNEVDPAWSLEVTRTERADGYIACYGTLTVKGVSRSGVGTNSPNRASDGISENEEKGAATDMLKRLARLFGIGLYLKKSPNVWLPADMKPWDAKPKAVQELAAWLNKDQAKRQQFEKLTQAKVKYPDWQDEDTTRRHLEKWLKAYAPDGMELYNFSREVLTLAKPDAESYPKLANVISPEALEKKVKAHYTTEPEPPSDEPDKSTPDENGQADTPAEKPTGLAAMRARANQSTAQATLREVTKPHPLHNEEIALHTVKYDPTRRGHQRWTAVGAAGDQQVRVTIFSEDLRLFERMGHREVFITIPGEKLLPVRVVLRFEQRNGLRVDGAWIEGEYVSIEGIREALQAEPRLAVQPKERRLS